jgi:murein L,D-transpeptidase YcbB/YkuD
MKNKWKRILALLVSCFWSFTAMAQITPESVQQFISDKRLFGKAELLYPSDVKEFYARFNYQGAWLTKQKAANLNYLTDLLKLSILKGLEVNDYQVGLMSDLNNKLTRLQGVNDSLEAELRITDAALHFYHDIAHGNSKPALGYNGLKYSNDCRNIPALLADHISKNTLSLLIAQLSPLLPEINIMEYRLRLFHARSNNNNYREMSIISKNVSAYNKPLLTKLYLLGCIDSVNAIKSDSLLKQKVKESQRQFNLNADGVLGTATIKELNTPLAVRIQQLSLSINHYRWLNCLIQNQPVIVVNIPAAYLKVYQTNTTILEMRMVVGKKSTRTPTLASTVTEVILYPYWHVPKKIATQELLPLIKRNPSFLDAGNYQVLNMSGRIIDPYAINWSVYSKSYFPFLIRQSTGCDNSLGLLKLNFYNPFGVYLHDTPSKNLFTLNSRTFSHGCMRMEKPMELGHLLLKDNKIAIDTLTQKGCLNNQSPITVHADVHMPVVVWYNPAGIDSTGRIMFYKDVYEKFGWKKAK